MINSILSLLLLYGHCIQPTVCHADSPGNHTKLQSSSYSKYGNHDSKKNKQIKRNSVLARKRIAKNQNYTTVSGHRKRISALNTALKNSELSDQEKKNLRVFINQERVHLKQQLGRMKSLQSETSRTTKVSKQRIKAKKMKRASAFNPKQRSKQVTTTHNIPSSKKSRVYQPVLNKHKHSAHHSVAENTHAGLIHTPEASYSVATVCSQVEEV